MRIINLTQHVATPAQIEQGVFEPVDKGEVQVLLTFDTAPSRAGMNMRSTELAAIASLSGATHAMIGGAPYFMSHLERALKEAGITPLYSFSERKSIDQPQADGTVRKVAVFEHVGWVEA